ncbi:coiled-coil-helix-coiled-coil-helix domain-containing protein 10, mitochondrial-like [Leptopilina boulardi]|uniref:coiled-coil-helix-coiled-coil-helix domain-containing protein 10, mitochondrial-like n=1 Tax=Leptopilina boulardi TaxID=63433 RepID=UPI0021F5C352|nr:coiled-coil-helix-coiled-coil-helix domain-containing protein 10, mitochondrial-like [Leptopilina boulardi]
MSGRKNSGGTRSYGSRNYKSRGSSAPQRQPQRGRSYSTVSSKDSLKSADTKNRLTVTKPVDNQNNIKQPSSMKNFIASAAGVAAGSAVGHAVGNTMSKAINSPQAIESTSSRGGIGICSTEVLQFFQCASQNSNLDTCKAFHNMMLECHHRHQFHN